MQPFFHDPPLNILTHPNPNYHLVNNSLISGLEFPNLKNRYYFYKV